MKCGRCRWNIRSNLMGNCFSSGYEQSLHEDHRFSSKKSKGTELESNEPSTKSGKPDSLEIRNIRTPSNPKSVTDLRKSPVYSHVDIFTYVEMTLATKQFRPDYILGEGGFGVIYKGVIDDSIRPGYKTTNVAVKELNPDGVQGDREWLAEINYLGQLSHPNLVKLVGYCCEDEHRLLVYEYMASGSLEKHLFRRVGSTLTWPRRMKIALDAAKGLAFLHDAERSVIYRDFKTSNILLDTNFNAKLSDFGLAKDGPMGDQTHVSTRVMGTYGYAAPEYVMTGHLTARSDVYGFGVVLLELLIGQRALDKSRPSREHNLVEWARPILNQNKKVLRILDPRLDGQYAVKTAIKVAYLAYQCLSQNPKGRPLMNEVVQLLETVRTEVDEASIQNTGSETTLYEDPSHSPHTPDKRRHARRNSSNQESEAGRTRAARTRSGSGSAPTTETDQHSPTLNIATPTRQ